MVYNSGSYTSMLKFTIDGRPTVEDIHDLFSSMVARVKFSAHKYMFRSYASSFISEDAINQLTAPPPSQPNMYSDSGSLKLNRDMAKALVQQFLWTRLIESSHEPQNKSYKDKGIWRLTSKGLCVFQDFLTRAKSETSRFARLVDASAKPMFLIQIERLQENDRMNCEKSHIASLFAIMIASLPLRHNNQNDIKMAAYQDFEDTYSVSSSDSGSTFSSNTGMRGLSFSDYFPHVRILPNDLLISSNVKNLNHKTTFQQQQALLQNLNPSSNKFKMRAMFSSMLCCNWLVDYCTVASNDEAESIMTEFLNLGWIAFYDEKYKYCDQVESSKSIALHVTKAGAKVVVDISLDKYNQIQQQQMFQLQQHTDRLSIDIFEKRNSLTSSIGSSSVADTLNSSLQSPTDDRVHPLRTKASFHPLIQTKSLANSTSPISPPLFELGSGGSYFDLSAVSPTTPISESGSLLKLGSILKNDSLQQLFRDFLSANFCVENLDFWIDHDKLLRNYHRQKTNGTMNQRQILEDAYTLWDLYLRPGTLRELNVDHTLREEMAQDISQMVKLVQTFNAGQPRSMMVVTSQSTTHSLNVILTWFNKVNDHVCRLMASDSVPRFIRTFEYRKYLQEEEEVQKQSVHPTAVANDLDDFPPPPQRQLKETLYF